MTGSPAVGGAEQVVRRPDGVTPEWVTRILRQAGLLAPAERVVAVEIEPVGTGQMADTVRLRVDYASGGGGPSTLVAKFASADERSHATGKMMRAYEAEVMFYGHLARRVTARVPTPLAVAFDPEPAWFTLVLEDIADAAPGDQILGCDADVASAALGGMAGLHAPCWEDGRLEALGWLNRSSPESDEVTAQVVRSVFPGFLERYGARFSPEQVQLLEAFMADLGTWAAARRGPRTVTHGDYRLDNLLFTPEVDDPVVVDFQTVAWSSPAYDLAYFLGGCLSADVRRPAEADLISEYHQHLVAGGVTGYPIERLRADYRRESLGGVMMAVGASMLVQRTERGDEMFVTSAQRHSQHALDVDALAVMGEGRR